MCATYGLSIQYVSHMQRFNWHDPIASIYGILSHNTTTLSCLSRTLLVKYTHVISQSLYTDVLTHYIAITYNTSTSTYMTMRQQFDLIRTLDTWILVTTHPTHMFLTTDATRYPNVTELSRDHHQSMLEMRRFIPLIISGNLSMLNPCVLNIPLALW